MRTESIEQIINDTRLPIVPRYRRGYLVSEVDTFLKRIVARHRAGSPVNPKKLDEVVFRVRFGGYHEWSVDVMIDKIARRISEGTGIKRECVCPSRGIPADLVFVECSACESGMADG